MPKMKTHTGAKKRFKLKKSGKIKQNKMNRNIWLKMKITEKNPWKFEGKRVW